MAFHLGAFIGDIDSAGTFTALPAAADDRLFTQGNDLRVPPLNQVVALAGGADGVVAPRIRLTSPTLTGKTRYEIAPLNSQDAANVVADTPPKLVDLRQTPLVLGLDEILQADLNNNPAVIREQWALVWFADGPITPVSSQNMFTVRATGATTLVAITWTSVTITLDDNLPPGTYQVVGLRAEGVSVIGARVIFRTADQWRPGCLGNTVITAINSPIFRNGQMGVWGEFPFTQLPAIEFLAGLADTAQTVHLDVIRIR